jgi:hypothetical protein
MELGPMIVGAAATPRPYDNLGHLTRDRRVTLSAFKPTCARGLKAADTVRHIPRNDGTFFIGQELRYSATSAN